MITKARATIDDLLRVPGKAELIDGEIVHFMSTGGLPNYAAGEIFAHLREYVKRTKRGRAHHG